MQRKNIVYAAGVMAVLIILALFVPFTRDKGGVLIYALFGVNQEVSTTLFMKAAGSRFITVGEDARVDVWIDSPRPINIIAAKVLFPGNLAHVQDFSLDDSIVNLWIKGPAISEQGDTLEFGGGIKQPAGFVGEGRVLSARFKALNPGKIELNFADATVLAHDGQGTEVLDEKIGMSFFARKEGQPSPDLNGDGHISISDMGSLLFAMSSAYDRTYDLNGDGKVNFSDMAVLRSFR